MESLKPRVRVSAGTTLNVGDFNSVRYDVAIEDSPREGETVLQAYKRIEAFVDSQLEEKVAATQQELANS